MVFRHTVPNGDGGVAFSPDGSTVGRARMLRAGLHHQGVGRRFRRRAVRATHQGRARSVAFSPDQRVLAAGTEDGHLELWDARSGAALGEPIQAAAGTVEAISFSPDGRLIAVSSADLTATLWDVWARKRIGDVFPQEPGSVPIARFAANGDLVVENVSETAIWPIGVDEWVRYACAVAGRDLTPVEWSDLLPGRLYRHVCPSP